MGKPRSFLLVAKKNTTNEPQSPCHPRGYVRRLCGKGRASCFNVSHLIFRGLSAIPLNVGRSPYSIMVKSSIRSKCFLFKVASGRLFVMAVAAMKRSAMSISFLFRLRSLFKPTATLATSLSKVKTFVFSRKSSQKSTCPDVVPVYISYSVIADMQ